MTAALDNVLPAACQRAVTRVIRRYVTQCAGAIPCMAELAKREAQRLGQRLCECGLAMVDHE